MEGLVRSKREQILNVAQRHGVTAVRVFGSMAGGDAGPDSDVDLLVDVGPQPSAWFPGGLVADLTGCALLNVCRRHHAVWGIRGGRDAPGWAIHSYRVRASGPS